MSNLRISVIQTRLFWEDKKANLAMLREKIQRISTKSELIILPEMFSTGFSMNNQLLAETMDGETVEWMKKTSAANAAILTGSIMIREDSSDADPKYYNRLIWMLPNGEYGYYDKRHLFAYGNEHEHYTAGKKRLIASVNGWHVNLQICYDLRFPVWLRQSNPGLTPQRPEYDLLIVVANWPAVRSHAWKTLLQARAIENQCYVIGVNRTGVDGNGHVYAGESLIVGPLGEVIKLLGDEEQTVSEELDFKLLEKIRNDFSFLGDEDQFFIYS